MLQTPGRAAVTDLTGQAFESRKSPQGVGRIGLTSIGSDDAWSIAQGGLRAGEEVRREERRVDGDCQKQFAVGRVEGLNNGRNTGERAAKVGVEICNMQHAGQQG